MSSDSESAPEIGARSQDPRVERLRPDPTRSAPRGRTLGGLWAQSDRSGFQRLYLTRDLLVYAEFSVDDILAVTDVAPDQAPMLGEQSTRVDLRPEAEVTITHTRRVPPVDEFDLDVRFGAGVAFGRMTMYASSDGDACMKPGEPITDPCDYSCDWLCKTYQYAGGGGCDGGPGGRHTADCRTDTCGTCATQCGTCATQLGETQCGTCNTNFGYTDCGTCDTDWGQTHCGGCDRGRHR